MPSTLIGERCCHKFSDADSKKDAPLSNIRMSIERSADLKSVIYLHFAYWFLQEDRNSRNVPSKCCFLVSELLHHRSNWLCSQSVRRLKRSTRSWVCEGWLFAPSVAASLPRTSKTALNDSSKVNADCCP